MSNTGLKKTVTGIPKKEFQLALENDALKGCDCGTICNDCYGFDVRRNYNSVTGDFEYVAVYFVDGVQVVQSIDAAKAAQDAFKNL